MKLYSEEQVRQMLSIYMNNILLDLDGKMLTVGVILSYREILSKITPIQLPSDEEVAKSIKDYSTDIDHRVDFTAGVEWVIEQIKKQGNGMEINN